MCERRAHRTRQRLAPGHLAAVLLRAELKAEFEAEIMMKLRNEFLQDRLDAERGVKRLRSVPPPALIA